MYNFTYYNNCFTQVSRSRLRAHKRSRRRVGEKTREPIKAYKSKRELDKERRNTLCY